MPSVKAFFLFASSCPASSRGLPKDSSIVETNFLATPRTSLRISLIIVTSLPSSPTIPLACEIIALRINEGTSANSLSSLDTNSPPCPKGSCSFKRLRISGSLWETCAPATNSLAIRCPASPNN